MGIFTERIFFKTRNIVLFVDLLIVDLAVVTLDTVSGNWTVLLVGPRLALRGPGFDQTTKLNTCTVDDGFGTGCTCTHMYMKVQQALGI
jgi:hypothetical protein